MGKHRQPWSFFCFLKLTGLALLVAGILAKFEYKYLLKLSSDINYNLAPYIMIGCGVFIFLMGLIGCWAAIKEHGWALKIVSITFLLKVKKILSLLNHFYTG